MNKTRKKVLTGTRPSGIPHLGNYFGAYKPAVDLQKSHKLWFFLADYHALNGPDSADLIKMQSFDITATMLACGLDPSQSYLYAQSHLPEVCELSWILGCQSPFALMLRAHSFKDAQAKGNEVNMGVFCYPVLMAADILLFDADLVPVGKDQKQHLEMARDIGGRFNLRYGDTFKIPEPLISEHVALVPGTNGEKMSKSKSNTIPIFASDRDWKKAVMSITTDSKGLDDIKDPSTCNIFQIFKLVESDTSKIEAMAVKYQAGGFGYGHAKLELLEAIKERFGQMRDRYFELRKNESDLLDVLTESGQKVREMARQKLNLVKDRLGVIGR